MSINLFGEKLENEAVIKFVYHGGSFDSGQMQIRILYTELQSLEKLIRDSISLLIKSGKLDSGLKDVDIYLQLEKGSFGERIKIIFKNPTFAKVAAGVITGLVVSTYTYFLSKNDESMGSYKAEIQEIVNNKSYKENLKNLILPIEGGEESFVIQDNQGTVNININYSQKENIVQNIDRESIEDPLLKNGEFEEELKGIIRKLDLDAQKNNYFGFNIDNGPSRVSTSVKGEFNLNSYKELINEHIKIKAKVRYKNDIPVHIEIIDYDFLSKQEKLNL